MLKVLLNTVLNIHGLIYIFSEWSVTFMALYSIGAEWKWHSKGLPISCAEERTSSSLYTHNPPVHIACGHFHCVTWPFPGLLNFSEWSTALPPAFPHEDQWDVLGMAREAWSHEWPVFTSLNPTLNNGGQRVFYRAPSFSWASHSFNGQHASGA